MKKTLLSILTIVAVSAIIVSCGSSETKETSSEMKDTMSTVAGVQYTCPMHPEVISDKPGSCPKCGMDLVKKETMESKPDSTIKGDSSMKMKM